MKQSWRWIPALVMLTTIPTMAARMATNLDLVTTAAQAAVRDALATIKLGVDDGHALTGRLLVRSQDDHNANWLVEQLLIEQLLAAGIAVTVDDKDVDSQAPQLAYRIVELGISGKGRVISGSVDRRCHVTIGLRYSFGGELVDVSEAKAQISDRIPGHQLDALQHSIHTFADTDLEKHSWARIAEPMIVTTVLGSLVYLFFSNR